MKYFIGLMIGVTMSLCLFAVAATAADSNKAPAAIEGTATDHVTIISEARYIPTKSKKKKKKKKKKSKKKKTIAQIRNNAIKNTLGGLGELRPYTTSYSRLKSAVRRYWKHNVRHPTARGLSQAIMRHVKRKHKKLVRKEVYSGSKSGVNKVKKELKKRKG